MLCISLSAVSTIPAGPIVPFCPFALSHIFPGEVVYSAAGNTAYVTSARRIADTSELTISYINTEQSVADRQRDLVAYGFSCDCEQCAKDLAPKSKQEAKKGRR